MDKPSVTLLSSTYGTAYGVFNQLNEMFSDMANIRIVLFQDRPEPYSVHDMLVVITTKLIEPEAVRYIRPGTKTLIADRVIGINEIYRLYEIPDGSDVLIVNNIYETTMESIEQLKACGMNKIRLHPYYPGIDVWDTNCSYAVTFGEMNLVPEGSHHVIDLGTRPFDITTCLKIAMELGIYDAMKSTISSAFIRPSIELSHRYLNQYRENRYMAVKLQQILNMFKSGVVMLDKSEGITFYNSRARQILKIRGKKSEYIDVFVSEGMLRDETFFYEVDGQNYHFEVIDGRVSGSAGTILVINDIKKIERIENDYRTSLAKRGLIAEYTFNDIIYRSDKMRETVRNARQFSKSNSTIAIYGESGCGKELIAQSVHNASGRRNEAFVAVNFAALSDSLGESELFGYEEGAFTGAKKGGKKGLFELAHNGTIFLDEIGDASLDIQKKILRVIQERKVMPVGGNRLIPVDIRIIAATNQDLYSLVKEKRFREDLYYRLNVLPVRVPPLRDRREDIIPLFLHFLNNDFNIYVDAIPVRARKKLEDYNWYGNIRELRNVAEYAANFMELGLDWESRLDSVLIEGAGGENADFADMDVFSAIYRQLEEAGEPAMFAEILRCISLPPYRWTRKALCSAMAEVRPELSESKIKRCIMVMKDIGLVKSKTGDGTYIRKMGTEYLKHLQE